jgi:hypothetical protein
MHEYLATYADAHHSGITFELWKYKTVYRYPPRHTCFYTVIQLYSYFFCFSHSHQMLKENPPPNKKRQLTTVGG